MTAKNEVEDKPKGVGGRPPGARNKIRSPLRKTQREIEKFEAKALENIKNSVEGVKVDKEVLATSKWVVNTKITISRAATAEEQLGHGIRQFEEELDNIEEPEEETPRTRFSLHVLPTAKDL